MNPTDETAIVTDPNAAAVVLAARAKVEMESRIYQALHRPRDVDAAFTKALASAKRPQFADGAVYEIPRGNQKIRGASVKLMRAIKTVWGNIHTTRQIYPAQPGWAHIEVTATDYETNTTETAQDLFRTTMFRRADKYKNLPARTVDLSTSTEGFAEGELRNLMARRFAYVEREAISKIIPFDLIEDVLEECEKTNRAVARGDMKTSPEVARRNLVKAFADLSVPPHMLETWLGHKIELISPEQVAELRGIHKAMQSGEATRDEFFTPEPLQSKAAEELEKKMAEKEKPKPEPKTDPELDENGQEIPPLEEI